MVTLPEIIRHKTHGVKVRNVTIGGGAPIVVQSMTNTDSADVDATYKQVRQLFVAGSEVIRLTVNTHEDDADERLSAPSPGRKTSRTNYSTAVL